MTLPFLTKGVRTVNRISTIWHMTLSVDYIEVSVDNGDRLRFSIKGIDTTFSVPLENNEYYVCLVIVTDTPRRFVLRREMAFDLINHVNRRKFMGLLSYEEATEFGRSCR